ncbi:MAG: delta-lactam-biosynthetic de-N-acetylase [Desulfotomaculaceae bacterium]|nr:delta-lactam-biosynthetic de-N-acetylase [Desulfotomaculaceae bacterium]
MKKQLEKLKNRKVIVLAAVVLLLGVSGYVMSGYVWQNQLGTARTGGPGETYPNMAAPDSQDGEKAIADKQGSEVSEVSGTPALGANANEVGAGSMTQVIEKPATKITTAGEPSTTTTVSQLSNIKRGWGLKRNSQHLQPEMPTSISTELSKYGAYWVGSPEQKVVYLTFDNGYENGYTNGILDTLKANNVKAAFFVTGHYLKSQPELIKRIVNEGHLVCNHTDTHPSLPDISDEQIIRELQIVEQEFEKITGNKGMKYLRPPKGEYSERTLAVTKELGYYNILWSLAMVDWVPMPGGSQEAYQSVMDNLHNGALILLHAVSKDTAGAMDRIIKDAKAQGYSFETLDDLVQS